MSFVAKSQVLYALYACLSVPGSCVSLSSAHACKRYKAHQPGIDGVVGLFQDSLPKRKATQVFFYKQYSSLFSSVSLSYYHTYENDSYQTPVNQRAEQKRSCLP